MADPQNDVPASATGTSSSNLMISRRSVLPGERNQYPEIMAVDFTQLRSDALRKYMAFHNIPEVRGSSKELMAVTVARHFHVECKKADERSSITSFVTFVRSNEMFKSFLGSRYTVGAAELLRTRPLYRLKRKKQDYDDNNENQSRQRIIHMDKDVEADLAELDVDDLYEHDQGNGFDHGPFMIKNRIRQNNKECRGQTDGSEAGVMQTKKRKGRLYCICKGGSFGNMIACDNKKCPDRSNWYHMSCVGLNSIDEPPETWYCPSCQVIDSAVIPENQYRKPVASVTYGDMISHALTLLPEGKGSFKDICDFIETEYENQLNWKLESDQRKSPVWKSSVRKILFSNVRFRKHPDGNGMFCLAT